MIIYLSSIEFEWFLRHSCFTSACPYTGDFRKIRYHTMITSIHTVPSCPTNSPSSVPCGSSYQTGSRWYVSGSYTPHENVAPRNRNGNSKLRRDGRRDDGIHRGQHCGTRDQFIYQPPSHPPNPPSHGDAGNAEPVGTASTTTTNTNNNNPTGGPNSSITEAIHVALLGARRILPFPPRCVPRISIVRRVGNKYTAGAGELFRM